MRHRKLKYKSEEISGEMEITILLSTVHYFMSRILQTLSSLASSITSADCSYNKE